MASMTSREFPREDLELFERLTEQESHSIEGQIAKMEMVEAALHDRHQTRLRSVTMQVRLEGGRTEAEITAEVQRRVQPRHISHMSLGDGRFNLIVEVGEDDPENLDASVYRVMIPAHVDTVNSGAATKLSRSTMNPDHAHGLGTYDMGAAVLNNIALATTVTVPIGMKVYFVFTVDEEMNSIGARELIRQWDVWPMIDAVISSEIGPLPPKDSHDQRLRLITARMGRVKFLGDINVDAAAQGHGSEENIPNASQAMRTLLNALETRFYQGFQSERGTGEDEPRQMRTHPLLGDERIEDGPMSSWTSREGYFPPDGAEFQFSIRLVPPSTREELEASVKRWARGIAKRGQWKGFGINHTVGTNPQRASYSSFQIAADHPVARVMGDAIRKVTGLDPELAGAPSVADECDYAADGKAVLSVPPNGDDAHHPNEWVSLSSILAVRQVIREAIESKYGFSSILSHSEKTVQE